MPPSFAMGLKCLRIFGPSALMSWRTTLKNREKLSCFFDSFWVIIWTFYDPGAHIHTHTHTHNIYIYIYIYGGEKEKSHVYIY